MMSQAHNLTKTLRCTFRRATILSILLCTLRRSPETRRMVVRTLVAVVCPGSAVVACLQILVEGVGAACPAAGVLHAAGALVRLYSSLSLRALRCLSVMTWNCSKSRARRCPGTGRALSRSPDVHPGTAPGRSAPVDDPEVVEVIIIPAACGRRSSPLDQRRLLGLCRAARAPDRRGPCSSCLCVCCSASHRCCSW